MAGILVSPSLDSQIRKRNALYKKRNESPKFRDILRKRCHARIKASRCALIDKFRQTDNVEFHQTLSAILKEEADRLLAPKPPANLTEDLEEPQESEEDQWLIDEYEKILSEEEAYFNFDWENQVICPLCEMTVLSYDGRSPACMKCTVVFPPIDSLSSLKSKLDSVLMEHSESCESLADFAIIDNQELSGLFLICEKCWCFSKVI